METRFTQANLDIDLKIKNWSIEELEMQAELVNSEPPKIKLDLLKP